MGGRSRGERSAERVRQEFDRMRAVREARLVRADLSSLGSDHRLVTFDWSRFVLVPDRFDSIEAVEEFLNG